MITLQFQLQGFHPMVCMVYEAMQFQMIDELVKLNREIEHLFNEYNEHKAQLN